MPLPPPAYPAAPPAIPDLVSRARAGDAEAFATLVRLHRDRLFRFTLRITRHRHDAEDVCQRTFISAWRNLAAFDTARPFPNWLFGIAYKDAVKLVTRRRPAGELPEVVCEADTPAHAAAAAETPLWDLARATLDPARYDILWMFYGEDLSVNEIARITGRAGVSVKVHLFRARAQLRGRLDNPADLATVSTPNPARP